MARRHQQIRTHLGDLEVPIPEAVLELESRSIGRDGEPTLAAAHVQILEYWRSGDRDRELGLHVMFLAWYLLIESAFLTGLDQFYVPTERLQATSASRR